MRICGIDEAGRGSVIGPMVVAGVVMSKDAVQKLIDLGVRDSKKLEPRKRAELSRRIRDVCEAARLIVLDANRVDLSTRRRGAEGLNMLEAKIFSEIINELKPDIVYIDLPSRNKESFESILRRDLRTRCRLILEHKADERYPIVSAASIVAKVERDRLIEELKSAIGDFGSGYPSDRKTRLFLREMALEGRIDRKSVRLSWRTLSKVLQRRLDEFTR